MKKLMVLIAAITLGAAAFGEAMYWQVSSLAGQTTGIQDSSWTMAQIRVVGDNTDTYLSVWTGSEWASQGAVSKDADGAWFDLTGYTGTSPEYSFILELVNDSFEIQGTSSAMTYSTLSKQSGLVQNFDSIAPLDYVSWNAGTVDLPEPTSGLMMLLGASLLALRRKQK